MPGAAEYSSDHFSLSIEAEPPAEIQQDRERLRKYTEELFSECQARVNDQVVATGEREPAPERSAPQASSGNDSRRVPPARGNVRPLRRPAPNGDGHGRDTRGPNGDAVSLKQIGFLRSLARDAGYSNDQLALLCEESTGKSDLRALTKREASQLIDTLRSNAA